MSERDSVRDLTKGVGTLYVSVTPRTEWFERTSGLEIALDSLSVFSLRVWKRERIDSAAAS